MARRARDGAMANVVESVRVLSQPLPAPLLLVSGCPLLRALPHVGWITLTVVLVTKQVLQQCWTNARIIHRALNGAVADSQNH